jgi:hypothetical protein
MHISYILRAGPHWQGLFRPPPHGKAEIEEALKAADAGLQAMAELVRATAAVDRRTD